MCFGDSAENVCQDCKHFVLAFKFDAYKNTQAYREAISEQFEELWNHSLKNKDDKGK